MAEGGERPIIIVKKKVHGGHGHHGGAWKVAFADFVTAMMALFMVLWLVGQSPKTQSAVGAYFRDPLGVASGGNLEINTGPQRGGAGFFAGGNTAVALDISFAAGKGSDGARNDHEMPELSNARSRLAQALLELHMDSWSRHVELTAVDEGLRIEIQDTEDESLFPSGRTSINPSARPMLQRIAEELALLPNPLILEGHTDSQPARHKDNWDISIARANEARRFLEANGLRRDQVIEVRGYADRRPWLWHRPTDPRNRRISILVLLSREDVDHGPENPDLESRHPLIKQLRKIDLAAQGPGKVLELEPNGHTQDPM